MSNPIYYNSENGLSLIRSAKVKAYGEGIEVEVHNGYDGNFDKYIVLIFEKAIDSFSSAENIAAFRIIGYKDWALRVYNVLNITQISDTAIVLETEAFDECDGILELLYFATFGNLYFAAGLKVPDFMKSFSVTFRMPRIKVKQGYTPISIASLLNINIVAMQENALFSHTIPIDSPLIENFTSVSLNEFLLNITLIGLSENINSEVLE